jgi:aspartyl-tRNA(Asn)/glutamyl-tRNA(Gln) amidotransferase subunit A
MTVDWSAASLVDTADAIRAGRVQAIEVMDACLSRYRGSAARLGCVIDLDEAAARRGAEQADKARKAGATLGPLQGIPMAHKDMFHRHGRASRCGSKIYSHDVNGPTATVMERLDRAGALDIGRVHTVEFALGPHGRNPNYPECRNPWNTDYIPGGSSSGAGVAVASRMVHAALGSDTGGSIRGPASVSGIVGLMPTNGRVSRFGTVALSHSLDHIGPLARTVRDTARILDVIAGADRSDVSCVDRPGDRFEAAIRKPGPLPRVGVARGYFDKDMHPDVTRAIDQATRDLVRAGVEVHDVALPTELMDEISALQPLVLKSEAAANHYDMMRSHHGEYGVEVAQRIEAGFFIPSTDYLTALKARGRYVREFARAAFAAVDVVLASTIPVPVPTIASTSGKRGPAYNSMVAALTRNTKVINFLGLPALNVPCGFTGNDLPTAFQLIGLPFREADLFRVGHAFQQETDWHMRQPPT